METQERGKCFSSERQCTEGEKKVREDVLKKVSLELNIN